MPSLTVPLVMGICGKILPPHFYFDPSTFEFLLTYKIRYFHNQLLIYLFIYFKSVDVFFRLFNRVKSTITDPLLIPTPSRISVTIRDIKKVKTFSNLMINMNKYIVLHNIKSYHCYLIKCNILFLLFKYLKNNFF